MIENTKLIPVASILLVDVNILVIHRVRGNFKLHITAGSEVNFFTFRQFQHKLLDESRNVVIRNNLAFPTLYAKEFRWNLNLQVLLYRRLARQAPTIFSFPPSEMAFLGRQHRPTTTQDLATTLGTGAATTTGRGEKNSGVSQGVQKLTTRLSDDCFLRITINFNGHVTARDHHLTGIENDKNQQHDDASEHADTKNDFNVVHRLLPLQ